MIRFRCSHCKKKFGVPDTYAGHRIRCNTCSHHTIVPNISTEPANITSKSRPPLEKDQPALYDDKTDDDLVLSLSQKEIPTDTGVPVEDNPMKLQFQSFHHYDLSASDTEIEESDLDKPDPKYALSELLKRCCPPPATDKIERAINILSNISCIGPVFFLFMIFSVLFIASHNESPRAMKPPFGIPDTGPITGPVSFLAAFPVIRYAFYVCAFGISPLALIIMLYFVFRYRYDIPKSLYFVMVIYGFILFVFFIG